MENPQASETRPEVIKKPQKENSFLKDWEAIKSQESFLSDADDASLAEKLAAQTGLASGKAEEILAEPVFQEQLAAVRSERQALEKSFRQRLSKAILPLLAMSSAEAGAASEQGPAKTAAVVEQVSSGEVNPKFLDKESPLALSAREIAPREFSAEEAALFSDMRTKALTAPNEWSFALSYDEQEKISIYQDELGPLGGMAETGEKDDNTKERAHGHTHPLAARGVVEKEYHMTVGPEKMFIMPPSSVDIASCLQNAESIKTNYVVDPRGIWEYRCDPRGIFAQSQAEMVEQSETLLERVFQKYAISQSERQALAPKVENLHPAQYLEFFEREIEPTHPGFVESLTEEMAIIFIGNAGYVENTLSYMENSSRVVRSSVGFGEAEAAEAIKTFIKSAGQQGIYLSYTPFSK